MSPLAWTRRADTGFDAEGWLAPDFRGQVENVFTTLEAILNEAGATLDDVASLSSYHVGDLHRQLRELVDIKATRTRPRDLSIWPLPLRGSRFRRVDNNTDRL
jgi:enamine deaminase RidA (YjgF/YER057c/UK114 family)